MVKNRIDLHMCENTCIITHLYLISVYHKHICNVIHVVVIKSEKNAFVDGIV